MGCVLCKPEGSWRGGGKSDAGAEDHNRPSSVGAVDGSRDEVVVRKGGAPSSRPSTSSEPRWSPMSSSFMLSPIGWPSWLTAVAGEALTGWSPRRADSFQKLSKIGQGTYSNVYKTRDLMTGKIMALKKVRFDNMEPESIKFMAREITLLRRLDHPNIIKLEGLVISRVSCSLYLIFEYMEHDLTGLAADPDIEFSLPQVKCYMKQLLSGLEHCHSRGVLHRDIKGSNLLIDDHGVLKIADFGLASSYDPERRQPMTSRVVTLWYRPPELILGATHYAAGVDLWSAGCILAELLAKKAILPGRTEVEQLHRIFKLCGSPTDAYWKKSKLPHANMFKPQHPYKCSIEETFRDFTPSSLSLIKTLLSLDPDARDTATAALNSEFFTSEPHACEPESLPHYPPSKEMDAKIRDEEAKRKSCVGKKNEGKKRLISSHRSGRAIPAPQANAELQINLNRRRLMARANTTSKSEKFPPPHQDGALGFPSDNKTFNAPTSFVMSDASFTSAILDVKKEQKHLSPRSLHSMSTGRKKSTRRFNHRIAPSQMIIRAQKPLSASMIMDIPRKANFPKRERGKELEVFGGGM